MKFKAPLSAIFAISVLTGCGGENFVPDSSNMLPAATNIWSGVRVYDFKNARTGGQKSLIHVFDVLGGNDNYVRDGEQIRGMKIRWSDGSEEWWNRDTWANQGGFDYFVRADDPAIAKKEWKIYTE